LLKFQSSSFHFPHQLHQLSPINFSVIANCAGSKHTNPLTLADHAAMSNAGTVPDHDAMEEQPDVVEERAAKRLRYTFNNHMTDRLPCDRIDYCKRPVLITFDVLGGKVATFYVPQAIILATPGLMKKAKDPDEGIALPPTCPAAFNVFVNWAHHGKIDCKWNERHYCNEDQCSFSEDAHYCLEAAKFFTLHQLAHDFESPEFKDAIVDHLILHVPGRGLQFNLIFYYLDRLRQLDFSSGILLWLLDFVLPHVPFNVDECDCDYDDEDDFDATSLPAKLLLPLVARAKVRAAEGTANQIPRWKDKHIYHQRIDGGSVTSGQDSNELGREKKGGGEPRDSPSGRRVIGSECGTSRTESTE
jgi:hypothetical protein